MVCIISSFYKAFMQFSSHSIELIILKQFLNYSAEENTSCIFFQALLISSSSIPSFILVWHSDYELSSKTQTLMQDG